MLSGFRPISILISVQDSLIDVLAATALVEALALTAVEHGLSPRSMAMGAAVSAREISGLIATLLRWSVEEDPDTTTSWVEVMRRVEEKGNELGTAAGLDFSEGEHGPVVDQSVVEDLLRSAGIKVD